MLCKCLRQKYQTAGLPSAQGKSQASEQSGQHFLPRRTGRWHKDFLRRKYLLKKKHTIRNKGSSCLRSKAALLPLHWGTLLLHAQSSEKPPCRWRSAQQPLHAPCNGWKLPSSPLWSAALRDPGQCQDPQPEPAGVKLLRPPRPRRHLPLERQVQTTGYFTGKNSVSCKSDKMTKLVMLKRRQIHQCGISVTKQVTVPSLKTSGFCTDARNLALKVLFVVPLSHLTNTPTGGRITPMGVLMFLNVY